MNFAKKLFLGSVIAMGAFGLVACGSDSSSNTQQTVVDPTDPVNQRKDDIIALSNPDQMEGIDEIKFYGTFIFDASKMATMTVEEFNTLKFTGVTTKLYKDAQEVPNAVITTNPNILLPAEKIILESAQSLGLSINLLQPALVQAGCGNYQMVITVNATDDKGTQYEYTQSIPFVRKAEEYCKEATPESSSSSIEGDGEIFMQSCTVDLSTTDFPAIKLDNPCIALDKASAATADVIFTKVGNSKSSTVTISSGTGVLFGEDTENDTNNWPEVYNGRAMAYMSDFKARLVQSTSIPNFMGDSEESRETSIIIAHTPAFNATTGAGFYAFGIVDGSIKALTNGEYSFTLKVYQAQ